MRERFATYGREDVAAAFSRGCAPPAANPEIIAQRVRAVGPYIKRAVRRPESCDASFVLPGQIGRAHV